MTKANTTAITEMRITRMFDAPRELVFRAFTDPAQLAQWFGPVGFSTEEIVIDLRPGGVERIVMVKDDGTVRHELESRYTEIVENELIVGKDAGPDEAHFRFEFHDEPGGKTRFEMWAWPAEEEWSAEAAKGWESSFTKLDALFAHRA